jgi:hypothetical protein
LVKIGAEGEDPGTDLMEIRRPDGLGDIADLGLTLSEAKLLLANVQREIAAAQARDHAVRRPDCPRCDGVCHVKDYRDHGRWCTWQTEAKMTPAPEPLFNNA